MESSTTMAGKPIPTDACLTFMDFHLLLKLAHSFSSPLLQFVFFYLFLAVGFLFLWAMIKSTGQMRAR